MWEDKDLIGYKDLEAIFRINSIIGSDDGIWIHMSAAFFERCCRFIEVGDITFGIPGIDVELSEERLADTDDLLLRVRVVRLLRIADEARELFQAPVIVLLALVRPWLAEHHAVMRPSVMTGRAATLLREPVAFEPAVIWRRSATVSIYIGRVPHSPALLSVRVVAMIDRFVKWPGVNVILLPVILRLRSETCRNIY